MSNIGFTYALREAMLIQLSALNDRQNRPLPKLN